MTYEDVCALLRRSPRPLLIHWRRAYLRLCSAAQEGAEGDCDDAPEPGAGAASSPMATPPKTPAPRATPPPSDAVPTALSPDGAVPPDSDLPWRRIVLPPLSYWAAMRGDAPPPPCAASAGADAATADYAPPGASATRELLEGGQLPPAIATAMAAAVATAMAAAAADGAADTAHAAIETAAALRRACTDVGEFYLPLYFTRIMLTI
jgi:hypothetical protein